MKKKNLVKKMLSENLFENFGKKIGRKFKGVKFSSKNYQSMVILVKKSEKKK